MIALIYRWEHANYPTFFFSNDDLPANFLHHKKHTDSGSSYDLVVGKKKAPSSVICYNSGKLAGLFKITFGAMDAWFEEEEEIFVHPKDPFKASQKRPLIIESQLISSIAHRCSSILPPRPGGNQRRGSC